MIGLTGEELIARLRRASRRRGLDHISSGRILVNEHHADILVEIAFSVTLCLPWQLALA